MKIVFTGAQGTGKTTVLDAFKDTHSTITEVVRNMAKRGIKINKEGNQDSQEAIFAEYERILTETPEFISDRCLIDVCAYTIYLSHTGKISAEFVDKQLERLSDFVKKNSNIVYCYFPIEFPVVYDGVRDPDEDFRTMINQIILILLNSLHINVVRITGTVEERIDKVKRVINWLAECEDLFSQIELEMTDDAV